MAYFKGANTFKDKKTNHFHSDKTFWIIDLTVNYVKRREKKKSMVIIFKKALGSVSLLLERFSFVS